MTPERRAEIREYFKEFGCDNLSLELLDDNERLERELADLRITLAGHEFLAGMGEWIGDE